MNGNVLKMAYRVRGKLSSFPSTFASTYRIWLRPGPLSVRTCGDVISLLEPIARDP